MVKKTTFKWVDERYWCIGADSLEMHNVGSLFSTEIGCPPKKFFVEWIDNPNIYRAHGNIITVDLLEKRTIIEIRNVLDEEEGPAFRMPKEEYIKMFWLWEAICKKRPREIIIFWDGKEITVEGRN